MPRPLHFLLLEDSADDARLILHELRCAGFEPIGERVATEADFVAHLDPALDIILADHTQPQFDALRALDLVERYVPDVPVIVITGALGDETVVECLKRGACDYLLKDRLARLGKAVTQALGQKQLHDEKRQAEQALRDSEARKTAILESALDAIITFGERGRIIEFNQAAETMFGYTRTEAMGRSMSDLIIPPVNREWCRDSLTKYLAAGEGATVGRRIEMTALRAGGIEFPVELSVTRIHENGPPLFTGFVRDITERKHAEQLVRRRLDLKQQLAMIAESVPGVICSLRMRPDGSVQMPFATPAILDLYGIPAIVLAEDFSPVFSNVHPDDAASMQASVDESFRRLAPWRHKFRYLHPAKGERWIEGWASAEAERDGAVIWHGFMMDVTDREQAEAGRRESERLARSVLDSLSSHIAVLDASGTILAVNHSWKRFAEANGAEEGAYESANYLQVCDSVTGSTRKFAAAFAKGIREVLAGRRKSFELEYPCHSPSHRRWFIGRVSSFLVGGPPCVVVAHENITAHKLAEELLRDSERMLEQSQRMADVGSWELDLNNPSDLHGGALRWSDECYRVFGYEPDQVAVNVEMFVEAIHADDRRAMLEGLVRALRENGRFEIEHRIVRPDGVERVVFEWGESITDPSGHPIRVLGTCQDITERKRTEDELRFQLRLNRAITEKAGESIFLTDQQGRLLFMNEEAIRVFGFTFEELAGTVLHDAIHHRYPDGRPFPWDECPSSKVSRSAETVRNHEDVFFRKDGSAVDAVCASAPLEIDGRSLGVVFILHDITERKRAAEGLQRYANRLERLRKIDLAMLNSQSPREIADAALEHLAGLVSYWTAGVALYDFDRGMIRVIANNGLLREWHAPGTAFADPLNARPEIALLRRGGVSSTDDVQGMNFTSPMMEALKAAGMRSYALFPLLSHGDLIGDLLLVSDRPAAFSTDQLEMAGEVADHLAIAIRQALLHVEVRSANERLEALSRQLIHAQEEEQRRIARELHDEVGQSLTAVKIVLDRLALDPSARDLGNRLRDAAMITGDALEHVRNLSRLLRPSLLDDLGLAEALRALLENLATRTGLVAESAVEEIGPIAPEVETACYRIAQEALTNAVKHAGATRLRVALRRDDDDLELVVEDNGTGFDIDDAMARATSGSSLGILGLQERAVLIGGWTEILSRPGHGTLVRTVVRAKRQAARLLTCGDDE